MLVVLVNGLPGSGKTTLARELARALELPLFSKDSVKETLADALGDPPEGVALRQWSKMLGAAAGETLWTLLGDTGRGAVLESPWLAHLRDVVARGLQRTGAAHVHEVWCEVPLDVARRRYEERASTRHPIHDDGRVDDTQWKAWAARAEPLAFGVVHKIDTTGPVDIKSLSTQIAPTLFET